jgi:uncharacterized protein GlcG (DUF336 family)
VLQLVDFVQAYLTDGIEPPAPADSRPSLLVEMAKREAENKAVSLTFITRGRLSSTGVSYSLQSSSDLSVQARAEHSEAEKSQLAQQQAETAAALASKVNEIKRLQSSRQAELAAASSAKGDVLSADSLTEITFASQPGGTPVGIEGTFKLVGGMREKLWTTYLAIPVSKSTAGANGLGGHNSSSSSLADLANSDEYDHQQPLSVTLVDFPTPYYRSNQGAEKLALLAETLRTKVLGLRSDQVVPVLSVQLGPGRGGKRLALLTGRVGRGERLRGVLRVCGRLEVGVARVSQIRYPAADALLEFSLADAALPCALALLDRTTSSKYLQVWKRCARKASLMTVSRTSTCFPLRLRLILLPLS